MAGSLSKELRKIDRCIPGCMTESPLTYTEAAARLRIKPDTLQRWVAAGRVPHLKYFNKRVFFTEEHIEEIIQSFQRGALAPRRRRK